MFFFRRAITSYYLRSSQKIAVISYNRHLCNHVYKQPIVKWEGESILATSSSSTFSKIDSVHAKELQQVLNNHDFNEQHVQKITEFILNQDRNPLFDQISWNEQLQTISTAIDFWKINMRSYDMRKIPLARGEKSNNIVRHEIKHEDVLAFEPELLLIDVEAMVNRINQIKNLGFLTGRQDLWRLFTGSPQAFFLQDWKDIFIKYNYVQYRIMEWLQAHKKNKFDQVHPLVVYPEIMNNTYKHIKSRFVFALNCGFKQSNDALMSEAKVVRQLLASDIDEYLKIIGPGLTAEEFEIFSNMLEVTGTEEDEMFYSLCELGVKQGKNWTNYKEDD